MTCRDGSLFSTFQKKSPILHRENQQIEAFFKWARPMRVRGLDMFFEQHSGKEKENDTPGANKN